MNSSKKIASLATTGRFLAVMLLLFLLSFLTVSNLFIYDDPSVVVGAVANEDHADNNGKRPINSEEEKSSSSKSLSGNLAEEYLHEHELFLHLHASLIVTPSGVYIHTHGFGDDHSRLHCPPPDSILS